VTISVSADTDVPPPPRAVRRRRTWIFAAVVVAFPAALVVSSISYLQALTYPGDASWSARAVEWIRDLALFGIPLLPTMPGTGRRCLVPDQRDFFAVTVT
jgi:hypothetical protein